MSALREAGERRARAMREAREQQIAAAAATGIKATTSQEVEAARIGYAEALKTAHARYTGGLPGDRRGNMPLPPEQMDRLAAMSRGEAEVLRLEYEDLRLRFEAQERRAADDRAIELTAANVVAAEAQAKAAEAQAVAAEVQAKAASASKWIAAAVALMVVLQTFFLAKAYYLSKWVADHPVVPASLGATAEAPPGPSASVGPVEAPPSTSTTGQHR